jgi:threonine/homoserine/homoserine lactone efflux protein
MYILARSLSQGYRAGLVSVLGLSAGALVHVAAATAGLSAILLASGTAFRTIKILGAGYLIYLGIRTLLARGPAANIEAATRHSSYRVFTDGVLVSVLNPKIAIFFLALLPQFAEPARGPVPRQIFLLGVIYIALALVTDSAYAILAGSLRKWISGRLVQGPLPRYAAGILYLGLGVTMALAGRRQ